MTQTEPAETMRPSDIFLYLIGNRGAIERIAATPWAWVVGAVLVISAGLARNYDHLDLLRQPSWIIGPFAASIFSTVFIFTWIIFGLSLKGYGRNLLTFLNLVWLTAPCAWIYGIPVELFTDLLAATKWNIAFLAIVSLWRVALIIRALSIIWEAPWLRVSLFVIAPAALEMMVGSFFKGLSLVGIMGGVRLPPHDELLRQATGFTAIASFWIFLATFIAMIFIRGSAKMPLHRQGLAFPKFCLIPATAAALVWAGIAIPFQPQIQNRHRLAELIRQQNYDAAIAFASSKQREDFPAIHYLAPDPTDYIYDYPLEPLEKLPPDAPAWLREEWTNNAIEAHKAPFAINDPERLTHLRDKHPEIFATLREYESFLRAKPSRTTDEFIWLRHFEDFVSPP